MQLPPYIACANQYRHLINDFIKFKHTLDKYLNLKKSHHKTYQQNKKNKTHNKNKRIKNTRQTTHIHDFMHCLTMIQ